MPSQNLPTYYKPHLPHSNRRAKFHNYRAPGAYMITITKAPEAPIFSTLCGDPLQGVEACSTILTRPGQIIAERLKKVDEDPAFTIEEKVIMPDHIHILWRVNKWLKMDFGNYVGFFKSTCSSAWKKESGMESLFLEKFNDRICFNEALKQRFISYIQGNPRKRLMVCMNPEIFSRRYRVRIQDMELEVYGNFNLLKHPIIAPVIVSRRYTDKERRQHDSLCEETIRTGGVLISPFIGKAEKAIMYRGISEGASIIRIIPDGIPPRYKPSGEEFELCAEGRCLHIGLPRGAGAKLECRRAYALELNELARWIAGHPAETLALINGKKEIGAR